jgi:hypothetical protein
VKDFAAEAERKRLAGDAHAAIEIAEAGLADEPANDSARIALALALIDVGDVPRARLALAAAFPQHARPAEAPPPVPAEPLEFTEPAELTGPASASREFADSLDDDELEHAFATAETNPDEMMSANRVVEQTLEDEQVDAPEAGFEVTDSPTYATESMATLLEEQGRSAQAHAMREALSADFDFPGETEAADGAFGGAQSIPISGSPWDGAGVGPDHANRLRAMATLESWLHNLKSAHGSREFQSRAGRPS